jgi:hypothetical protein
MYTLMNSIPLRRFVIEQSLALGISFLIAGLFYKFGNFALEAVAFLATWYVIDFAIQTVRQTIMMKFIR